MYLDFVMKRNLSLQQILDFLNQFPAGKEWNIEHASL